MHEEASEVVEAVYRWAVVTREISLDMETNLQLTTPRTPSPRMISVAWEPASDKPVVRHLLDLLQCSLPGATVVARWDLEDLCPEQVKSLELRQEQARLLNKRRRSLQAPQMHSGKDASPFHTFLTLTLHFSLLAGLSHEEPENPASPPSVAASPALPKADLAASADKKESDS